VYFDKMATPATATLQQTATLADQHLAISTVIEASNIVSNAQVSPPTASDLSPEQLEEEILAAVHKHDFFPDNKDFVDCPYKASQGEVFAYFKSQVDVDSKESVAQFLEKYFDQPASELIHVVPEDWKPEPEPISKIQSEKYRNWAAKLNEIWLELCRQVKPKVKENPDRYSLIYVPHMFVAPGGRFREFYYWDSYWVIKGLLASEMNETAKQVIRNFAYIVQLYGFIPNGQRKYYLNRSHPPLFIPMAYECVKATDDLNFLKEMMPALEAEFQWWFHNRQITVTSPSGKTQEMFRYFSSLKQARPESYMADIHTASEAVSTKDRENMYQHIAAAAESGWDFSSRWFADGKSMSTISTALILPVDLNAFLCNNAKLLGELHQLLGNHETSKKYAKQHEQMVASFNDVFWNEEEGAWFDYYLDRQIHNKAFYGSLGAPIFSQCYKDVTQAERAFQYITKCGALAHEGGVPCSLAETGQQWDFPNGWSPLVHMLILGLKQTEVPSLQNSAKEIAKTWLQSNYRQFERSGHMFEKYNVACKTDAAGCGGEYAVQTGFGWSNGTVLDILSIYHNEEWAESPAEV